MYKNSLLLSKTQQTLCRYWAVLFGELDRRARVPQRELASKRPMPPGDRPAQRRGKVLSRTFVPRGSQNVRPGGSTKESFISDKACNVVVVFRRLGAAIDGAGQSSASRSGLSSRC